MNLFFLILAICTVGTGAESCLAALRHAPVQGSVTAAIKPAQTGLPEGNLPSDRYQQLRLQTLAHARLITGPRVRNPRIAGGGLDRDILAALSEQRFWRQSHLGTTLAMSGNPGLLSDQAPTLLKDVHGNPAPPLQPNPSIALRQTPSHPSCAAPAIRSINGKAANVVFTPAEPNNHFRIEGCSFGAVAGTIRLQPSSRISQAGDHSQLIPLHLDGAGAWRDDTIDVYIDPGLKSISDFPADLVIQLSDGREAQLSRCMFVAIRGEPQLLKGIPAAWVTLDATSAAARPIQQLEFESPPFTGEQIPEGAAGTSAFVSRSDAARFSTGKDIYELAQLAPGWTVESVQLNVFDASCPGENNQAESKGTWTTNWSAHGFVIAWSSETCSSHIPPLFNFTLNSSQYAVRVWLIGPAGTQPLRGGF